MSILLSEAAERVTKEISRARSKGEGFRAVCERLGVSATELNVLVAEEVERLPAGSTLDGAMLHGMLIGVAARSEDAL
jgi:hypothetical protein